MENVFALNYFTDYLYEETHLLALVRLVANYSQLVRHSRHVTKYLQLASEKHSLSFHEKVAEVKTNEQLLIILKTQR